MTLTPKLGFMRCRLALRPRPSTLNSSMFPISSEVISISPTWRSSEGLPPCDGKESFRDGRPVRLAERGCEPAEAGPESKRGRAGMFIREGGACRRPGADGPTEVPLKRVFWCEGNSLVVGLELGLMVDKCWPCGGLPHCGCCEPPSIA